MDQSEESRGALSPICKSKEGFEDCIVDRSVRVIMGFVRGLDGGREKLGSVSGGVDE